MPDAQITNSLSPRQTVRPRCPPCQARMEIQRVAPGETRFRTLDTKVHKVRPYP
jgi:hypothetical protein